MDYKIEEIKEHFKTIVNDIHYSHGWKGVKELIDNHELHYHQTDGAYYIYII